MSTATRAARAAAAGLRCGERAPNRAGLRSVTVAAWRHVRKWLRQTRRASCSKLRERQWRRQAHTVSTDTQSLRQSLHYWGGWGTTSRQQARDAVRAGRPRRATPPARAGARHPQSPAGSPPRGGGRTPCLRRRRPRPAGFGLTAPWRPAPRALPAAVPGGAWDHGPPEATRWYRGVAKDCHEREHMSVSLEWAPA